MIHREEPATIAGDAACADRRCAPAAIFAEHAAEHAARCEAWWAFAHGLTDERARTMPAVSPLSTGWSVRHVVPVERGWLDTVPGLAVGGVTG